METGAKIKYSTMQKVYVGDEQGKGGIYNFLTEVTQVETGSAITWKYPSMVLESDDSVGEFYSVALTNNYQQADTGTTMIHKGKNTKSRIISKGILAGHSRNCYRGLVQVQSKAENAKSTSTSNSTLIADKVKNPSARVMRVSQKIGKYQLFYFQQRGIDHQRVLAAMIFRFCREIFNKLPDEFGAEVNQLIGIKLEGSVG
ncbi:hypothetical protein BRARA_B02652 [Brassica rapa]|uniref:SUF system FeS cluster assembly SufBD core domain-containing protein n=1 Tax=Brassica campestris TaxID=3711 RepID=A0A398ACX3_BRACM|nr:hypothetical protein BRARA_B02652 [Brassica rapa]